MKYIQAIVKPGKVDAVREALNEIGIFGMSAIDVKGFGRQLGQQEIYRGAEYTITFVPKVSLEIGVPNDRYDEVMETILQIGHTETIGAGKVFTYAIEQVLKIRTGDYGPEALQSLMSKP